MKQWTSEEHVDSGRNWETIDEVVRIAKDMGATPAQVALSWIADRPVGIAPKSAESSVFRIDHVQGQRLTSVWVTSEVAPTLLPILHDQGDGKTNWAWPYHDYNR